MALDEKEATADTLAAGGAQERELSKVERACYDVGEELARGGLGRILQATDRRLDRPVAIKELLREDPDHAARLAREAFLTARLQHPAIVPVYEAGCWPDGAPFYAMKLVAGKSLEAAVRERDSLAERLELLPHVVHVIEALAYAHSKNIIHRDLKPANVLVGAFGETVVIDWGLAKDLSRPMADVALPGVSGGSGGHTEAGSVMGTPAYMPPEQAMGHQVDSRADVYALGALLYHVIAGGPPYSGTSSQEILSAVVREHPESLEEKEPGVPRELAAIVRKAMARDPDDRYPTAAEMAADLSRFQRGLLVTAHEYGTAHLVARWAKKNRAPLGVAAAMLALLAAVVVVDVRRIVSERDRARVALTEAERLRVQADSRGDALALREAEALLPRDPRGALGWLARLSQGSTSSGAARVLAADAIARGVPSAVLADIQADLVVWSPDGRLLGAARQAEVLVIDVTSRQRVTLRGHAPLAFSASSRRLVYAGESGAVWMWDRVVRAQTELTPEDGQGVTALAFDGEDRVVAADADGKLRIWDLAKGGAPRVLVAGREAVRGLDVRDGRAITACGGATLWDLAAGKQIASLPAGGSVERVRFTSGGQALTVASDLSVRLWDAGGAPLGEVGECQAVLTGLVAGERVAVSGDVNGELRVWDLDAHLSRHLGAHVREVRAMALAGERLVSSGRDGVVLVTELGSGATRTLRGHEAAVVSLAVNGDRVASASEDGTVRLWDLAAGQPRVWRGGAARRLAASPDGRSLVTGGEDDLGLPEEAAGSGRKLASPGGEVTALAVSPDGAGVAAGVDDGRVLLYATGGQTPAELARLRGSVMAVAFDLKSRLVAAAGAGGLRVVDVQSGTVRVSQDAPVAALAFSPGGSMVAAAGDEVRLVDVETGKARLMTGASGPFPSVATTTQLVAAGNAEGVVIWRAHSGAATVLRARGGPYTALWFMADGKTLVALGIEGAVRVFDTASGESKVLDGIEGAPLALAVSPDGQSVAASSTAGTAHVWDVGSARGRTLVGHKGEVTGVVFLPGGSIATAGADATVRVWPDGLPHDAAALRAAIEEAKK